MKILYSLAQDGRGHASRGYEIISRLAQNGHKVMVFTGGDTYEPLEQALKGMKKVYLRKLRGFQCVYKKDGKINYAKTVSKCFPVIVSADLIIKRITRLIEKYHFDFAITDFEPFLPRAAKKKKLRFITIDNQHKIMFGKRGYDEIEPKHLPSYFVAQGVVRSYHPFGRKCIIVSVFKPKLRTKRIRKTGIIIAGPIIRHEVEDLKHKVTKKDFVLVYVKPVLEKAIVPVLKKIDDQFIMYVKSPEKMRKKSNILYKAHSAENFAHDLARCRAVISSAGEQLMSESLYLGKPVFLMPEGGNFEQIMNGYSVKKAKVGDFKDIAKVNEEDILAFLKNLDSYEKNIKKMKIKNSIDEVMRIIYSEMNA
jgi:uncharacterized protein (TIGR00661 family)